MRKSFTLDYWADNGWYVGVLREVPGVCSQGKTLEELKENIRDAYEMMMEKDFGSALCKELFSRI